MSSWKYVEHDIVKHYVKLDIFTYFRQNFHVIMEEIVTVKGNWFCLTSNVFNQSEQLLR